MTPSIILHGFKPESSIDTLGIGVFDGFHRGHQAISSQCDTLLSFHPHPALVLGKKKDLTYITLPDELEFFTPHLITLEFSESTSKLSAEDFFNHIILSVLKPRKIVVGFDFKFGFKQQGTTNLLNEWCDKHSIEFECIEPFQYNNIIVKSSQIRSLLINDKFNDAIEFLGHDYLIKGTVIQGEGRGKKLGFPTANIKVREKKLIPHHGVYAGYVALNERHLPAGIYIGNKPTFENINTSIEVHIINFNQDLYGQDLNVFLTHKIRDDQK